MTREELIARAEDLVAALNQADLDRIVSAFCVGTREAVREEAETLLDQFPDLELEILRTLATGNVVTMQWLARASCDGSHTPRPGVTVADYDPSGRISTQATYLEPAR